MKPTRRTFMQTLGLLPFFKPAVDSIKMRPAVEKVLEMEPYGPTKNGELLEMSSSVTMQSFPKTATVEHIITTGDEYGLPTVKKLNMIDPTGQRPIRPLLDKLPKQSEDDAEEAPWSDTGVPMG